MSLSQILERIPESARDIKLNLESILSAEGASGLTGAQKSGIALSSAYATENKELVSAITGQFSAELSPKLITASQSATAIMAMNNVYYRFLHLSEDKEFSKMRAGLRMNVIGKPGIEKVDFELMCLAVSSMSGCGSCINSHIHEARKGGISSEGIQSSIKIASIIQAASRVLSF
ncbi:MAG: carboxymuconolactone decarboxylase family protein [Xanthomonadaceae bacterium]|nr:carboxymuconolactone decarboxylase family protein [Xanthomonadaceae bacterium]